MKTGGLRPEQVGLATMSGADKAELMCTPLILELLALRVVHCANEVIYKSKK